MKVKNLLPAFYFILGLSLVFAITGYAVVGNAPSSVSIDGLRIIADTFNGTTTVFEGLSTSELNNMTNLILEKTSYGKVIFNESINLTQVAGADRIVNFDNDLNISDNLIVIGNVNLPYMDKLATVFIYNLAFTNPQIINGGVTCTDCRLISYSGGTLIFNTTSFSSAYYIRESPAAPVCGNGVCESGENNANCPADCPSTDGGGGGGGGGGGTTTPEIVVEEGYDFYVEPDFFNIKMNRGEYFQKNILVVNNGTKDLEMYIAVSGVSDFIFPQVPYIQLKAGENYTLRLDIYISESRPTDVYVGKVLFLTRQIDKESKAILDVKERSALFDIRTEVLKKYVNPGGRTRANISIINMGDLRNFDVSLEYKIVDFDNKEYTVKKEDFAMNKTYFNIFYLDVPKDISIGDFVFYARVNYQDVGASSFDTFTVERLSTFAWIIVIVVILLIIFLIVRRLRRDKRLKKKALKEQLKEKPKVIKLPLIRRTIQVPKLPEF